jgi:hypothetical protein
MFIVWVMRMASKGGLIRPSITSVAGLMRPSDLAWALVVRVVLRLLVGLSRRLCRGGKATP